MCILVFLLFVMLFDESIFNFSVTKLIILCLFMLHLSMLCTHLYYLGNLFPPTAHKVILLNHLQNVYSCSMFGFPTSVLHYGIDFCVWCEEAVFVYCPNGVTVGTAPFIELLPPSPLFCNPASESAQMFIRA